jgi:hypothetical protein
MAALTVLVVSGCGGSGDTTTTADVATLRSDGPVASSAPAQERPLIRPDSSTADIKALEQAHFQCLEKEGVPVAKSENGEYGKPQDPAALQDKRWGPAFKACASKEPESWLDRERRDNPEFADYLREAVKCLQKRGFKAHLDGDPPQIRYSSTKEFMRAGDAEVECQNEAFSSRIKELYAKK